jgi:YD repeat-containing protein
MSDRRISLLLRAVNLVLAAVIASASIASFAGIESYQYDPLGRLIRFIDSAGGVTEYVYDPAGNIREVKKIASEGPLTITAATPTSVRRNQMVEVTVTGANLIGAGLTTGAVGVAISNLLVTSTKLTFNFIADNTAPIGSISFAVSRGAISKAFSITLLPALPAISVDPSAIILVSGTNQTVKISITNPDSVPHTILLSTEAVAIAKVSPASITIPAGSTEATATVTSVALGVTALKLTSTTLASTAFPIFVAQPFKGPDHTVAPTLGIFKVPSNSVGPVSAPVLGVTKQSSSIEKVIGPIAAPVVGIVKQNVSGDAGVGPVAAPVVGVVKQVAPVSTSTGPIAAPSVGIVKPTSTSMQIGPIAAPPVGVAK